MPSFPGVPSSAFLVRCVRRAFLLASAGLALSAASAAAAPDGGAPPSGGAEAGDTAAASQPAPASAAKPAPASAAKPTRAAIRSVQRKLRLKADGVYGRRTQAAVRRFQRRRGLKVDGRLSPETLSALGVVGRAASAEPTPAPPSADASPLLEAIAQCESGGDPTKVSADGQHRGKYQFLVSTWEGVGGAGDPAAAPEAEQDQRAAALLAAEGTKPWPVCGSQAERALQ